MKCCSRCAAKLSDWEIQDAARLGVAPCWCDRLPRGAPRTLANLAYSELCQPHLTRPVKTHDVMRFVTATYTNGNPRSSMSVALSGGKRFCWGGQALYGLARHGLIPGARSLAEAAYAVLLAAPRELHVEEVDFVLEQLSYRFNPDSLLHHLRGYTSNRWDLQFQVDHRNRAWVKLWPRCAARVQPQRRRVPHPCWLRRLDRRDANGDARTRAHRSDATTCRREWNRHRNWRRPS